MEPEILFLTSADEEQTREITRLYKQQGWWEEFDGPGSVERIVAGSHCFAVALIEGRIVGMGRAISDRVSDAYIQDVVVDPSLRGRDIGSRIIRAVVARLVRDGLGWISLVAEGGSRPFYERLSFQAMEDCVAMRYSGKNGPEGP